LSQIDLQRGQKSGLRDALEVLKDVPGISFTFFTAADVVRHPLVARIVRAYDRRDEVRELAKREAQAASAEASPAKAQA
jgi:phosphate starvation-inducible PhoH-like protein